MFFNNKFNIEITALNIKQMIEVNIKISDTVSKTIDIEMFIPNSEHKNLSVQLPAWRPGRYELQNFAKNITDFESFDENNSILENHKSSKDCWEISAANTSIVKLKYSYYCNQMDAGGSYITNQMLYINFINCIVYETSNLNIPYKITLSIPDNYTIACGMAKINNKTVFANSYYELVDCPLIASSNLQQIQYQINDTNFNIWIEGNCDVNTSQIVGDFKKFTLSQLNIFKTFPFSEYHFLFIILPYAHYHGVEHHNSTVIVLGPDFKFNTPDVYNDLLGISCHELFHAWNALKIKPKELSPYDFTGENYFDTGFVIEGFTTYYGDYLLAKSGVWDVNQYMYELNIILKREFDNFGNQSSSLSRSSVELWLDGYVQGIPNRKVSIYTKGCIFALILDLKLRSLSDNQKSLDDVMLVLWENFGKTGIGYQSKDIINIVNDIAEVDLKELFQSGIYSTTPLQPILNEQLEWIGCELKTTTSKSNTENYLGFRVIEKEGKTLIDYCEPNAPANLLLAKNDELIAINGRKITQNIQELVALNQQIDITLFRDSELKKVRLHKTEERYFKQYVIEQKQNPTPKMIENFKKWLNI